ncbi:shikimate dehydrogenase [Ectobacillus antri]|uniref:Shikimate dehydrogenase (NADP(+)) n=1 Tax=Ectobacillus antri TaxID=2486280 RepID=A0ABT6H2J8_9BACI|nr:shikimate dehydrogenase [Ectobacillus antri]MDG4655462.1 shikimate dehydrogenase [Ectobacillus antri]MDG5753220.1 shikimate dehydrogenase [Ectobacillus antri]
MGRLYGVIGDPIGHSLSPAMHNDAFLHQDIDAHYEAFHIKEAELADAIQELRAKQIDGFNVTTPHKETIMQHLDEIDDLAKRIGAVNTVVRRGNRLIGYNTDGIGYVRALQELSGTVTDKRILLVGAGGACKAIYFSLASVGAKYVDIANRTAARAQAIVASGKLISRVFTPQEVNLEAYDIIINTTTVGMYPQVNETPVLVQSVKQHAVVSDIIYNPFETKLLQDAKRAGAMVQNGIDMFVYQGALAFELWTGIWPDVARMKKLVIQKLGG